MGGDHPQYSVGGAQQGKLFWVKHIMIYDSMHQKCSSSFHKFIRHDERRINFALIPIVQALNHGCSSASLAVNLILLVEFKDLRLTQFHPYEFKYWPSSFETNYLPKLNVWHRPSIYLMSNGSIPELLGSQAKWDVAAKIFLCSLMQKLDAKSTRQI
jgi:hypothetical protein